MSNGSDWAPFLQVCAFWVTGFVTELQYNFILSLPITIQLLFALQLSPGRLLWWQHAGWHVLQHLWLREWCLLSPAHNSFWRNLQDPCYFWAPLSKIWLEMGNKLKHKDDKMGSPWDHMKLPPPGNMSKTYLKLGDGVWCVRKRSSFTWQSQSMGRAIQPSPRRILLDHPHSHKTHSHPQLKALSCVYDGPALKAKDPGNAESRACHLPPSLMHHTLLRNEGSEFLEIEWKEI